MRSDILTRSGQSVRERFDIPIFHGFRYSGHVEKGFPAMTIAFSRHHPSTEDSEAPIPVEDRGAWLATSTGGKWSILRPHPADVLIEDLAAGLARTCRYAGQIRPDVDFYSVSEHCVLMTDWAINEGLVTTREDALAILLHDAAEAFYGDMPTPLKELMPDYRAMEDRGQATIMAAFGLTPRTVAISKADIKLIDRRIRMDEREALILEPALSDGTRATWDAKGPVDALGVTVMALSPSDAQALFLDAFARCCTLPPANPDCRLALRQLERLNEKSFGNDGPSL
jgi:uncharacterized protein